MQTPRQPTYSSATARFWKLRPAQMAITMAIPSMLSEMMRVMTARSK